MELSLEGRRGPPFPYCEATLDRSAGVPAGSVKRVRHPLGSLTRRVQDQACADKECRASRPLLTAKNGRPSFAFRGIMLVTLRGVLSVSIYHRSFRSPSELDVPHWRYRVHPRDPDRRLSIVRRNLRTGYRSRHLRIDRVVKRFGLAASQKPERP